MTSVLRSARLELFRLATSPRWTGVIIVLAAAAYLAAGQVDNLRIDMAMGSTAWDVHATLVNNIFYLTLLVMPAFLFLVGDTITSDVDSHFTRLAVTRAGDRRSWLGAKMIGVVAAALVVQLMLLTGSLALGFLQGKPLTSSPSDLAQYRVTRSSDSVVDPLFRPSAPTEDMAFRQVAAAAYLWLTFSAVGCAFVAITINRSGGAVVVISWLVFSLLDRILNMLIRADWYTVVSPTLRLVESAHSDLIGAIHPQLATSVAVFAALWGGAALYGMKRVVTAEL